MTKEAIEARLKQLNQDHERLVADAHATWGAIQDCEYWLAQFAAKATTGAKPVEDSKEQTDGKNAIS